MKVIQLLKKVLNGIKDSIIRFPQTIGISIACVIFLIYISELGYEVSNELRENLVKATMVLGLGIPLSLCINLYFERLKDFKRNVFYGVYAGGVMLLSFYYYFFLKNFEMISITRYIGLSLILYLVFMFIPYISKEKNFELYVIKVFARFFTTILYSVVLYLGLAAILMTIDKLLGVHIKEELYYYTWLIVVGVFASAFFLAGIPKNNKEMFLEDYSKLIKILVLYIVIPLISVYTVILYVYFAKIIITRQWPQGLVSHLVLWYSTISVIVLFLISPLLSKITWIKLYMKVFPKIIIPLMIMMFISIGIRIKAYGVTENRYFVVALGIWVIFSMVYFSLKKKLINIMIPISLAVIIFISVFGPFSSYSISRYSQNKRFEKLLIENKMLINGKAVKATSDVSDEDARQISSILRYFRDYHSLKDIKSLPEDFIIEDTEEILGVKYDSEYNYPSENMNFYFNIDNKTQAVDIKGYDYFFDLTNTKQIDSKDDALSVSYDFNSSVLKIYQNGQVVYSKDLLEFAEKLLEKYDVNGKNENIPLKDMILIDENDKIKVKILFSYVSGSINKSTGETEFPEFYFNVFVKVK